MQRNNFNLTGSDFLQCCNLVLQAACHKSKLQKAVGRKKHVATCLGQFLWSASFTIICNLLTHTRCQLLFSIIALWTKKRKGRSSSAVFGESKLFVYIPSINQSISSAKFAVKWEETNLLTLTANLLTALLFVVNSPQHRWHNKQIKKTCFTPVWIACFGCVNSP